MNGPQIGIAVIGVNDPGAKTLAWNQLLSSTYELYRRRFWTFFRMAALPAIVAYCFGYGWRIAFTGWRALEWTRCGNGAC